MKKSFIFIQILCCTLLLGMLSAEEAEKIPLKDIRDVISSKEYQLSGLNKLSDEELKELSGALYGWKVLRKPEQLSSSNKPEQKSMPTKPKVTVRQEQAFGQESIALKKQKPNDQPDPKLIHSHISGNFNGWKGNTVFELDNGQVWRQTDKSKFHVRVKDPEVEIQKGFLGTYFLSIEGYGTRCKVTRVR